MTHRRRWAILAIGGLCSAGAAAVMMGPATATPPMNPVADLAAIPVSGTASLTVALDGSGTSDPNPGGSITSWNLNFGDGSAADSGSGDPPSPTASHVYADAGNYTATLTVTDNFGLSGTSTETIVVSADQHQPGAADAQLVVSNAAPGGGIHKIKHVVVIMQENRSFDSYFGTYPGADGIPMNSSGKPTVCVPDPARHDCVYPYHDTHDIDLGGPHHSEDFTADLDGGKMDGFISEWEKLGRSACNPSSCSTADDRGARSMMGYHTAAELPNYWDYASHFTLLDHLFESESSYSLPSHLAMVSGWSAQCTSSDPMSCKTSLNPTWPANDVHYAWTDLTWLLHQQGVSWKYYVGTGADPDCADDAATCNASSLRPPTANLYNPLPNFDDVSQDGQLGNIVSTAKFYPAAQSGTLPNVSWVVPSGAVSEHPPSRIITDRPMSPASSMQ